MNHLLVFYLMFGNVYLLDFPVADRSRSSSYSEMNLSATLSLVFSLFAGPSRSPPHTRFHHTLYYHSPYYQAWCPPETLPIRYSVDP